MKHRCNPEEYEGTPHRCDWDCLAEVDNEHDVCDQCLVDNAESCGDWDEDAARALVRIKTRELQERVKALEGALRKVLLEVDYIVEDGTLSAKDVEINPSLRNARALLTPISEAHGHLITKPN